MTTVMTKIRFLGGMKCFHLTANSKVKDDKPDQHPPPKDGFEDRKWLPFYAQMKDWDRVRQRDEAMQTHTSSLFSQHDIDDEQ